MKKTTFFTDFKKFVQRGNVIDLAVAVVVGSAFNKIVSSLVSDIIMPLLGTITGKMSLSELKWTLIEASGDNAGVIVNYGQFIQNIIDFLIIALVVFTVVRSFNSIKDKLEEDEKGKKALEEKTKADADAAAAKAKADKEAAEADKKASAAEEQHLAIIEIRDIMKEMSKK